MADDVSRPQINRLYWESDRSVADIANELGVSRRSLYESIDPRPAGAPCPVCGASLGFRNRTAAENREAECAECGYAEALESDAGPGEAEPGPVEAESGPGPMEPGPGEAEPGPVALESPEEEQVDDAARLSPLPPRRIPDHRSGPLLGTSLLAGLALGAAAAFLIRRR